MGEEIKIIGIEIIYNGLFQIDFQNTETKETYRCFTESKEFFGMIGSSMQKNYEEFMDKMWPKHASEDDEM